MSLSKSKRRTNRKRLFAVAAFFLLTGALLASAAARWQFPAVLRFWKEIAPQQPAQNNSEFVIARIQYTARNEHRHHEQSHNNPRHTENAHGLASWAHTYPQAEEHILQLASEATGVNLNSASHVVVRLDSDELFQYPFAYLTEPGEMNLTDREAANLREYLDRGGFIMVDDFNTAESLDWFVGQMRKVFSDRRLVELNSENPIFHAFYDTPTVAAESPYDHAGGGPPKFYGYYDGHGRLCMIVNHDNNLGAFWVWLDQPAHPLRSSMAGARFGLNYFLYSLTH
jgi:hypothetical protein